MGVINTEIGLAKAGGSHDLARDLFDILQEELKTALSDLSNPDMEEESVRKLAHKLRSSARYCAAEELEKAAEKCELSEPDGKMREHTQSLVAAIESLLNQKNPY